MFAIVHGLKYFQFLNVKPPEYRLHIDNVSQLSSETIQTRVCYIVD